MRKPIAIALLLFASSAAQAQELTPEVHVRLFAATKQVTLNAGTVRVPMLGSDHQGNSKCPYFQVYVNGQGPFTFLFDTGAAYSIVSSKVVQAARTPTIVHRTRRDVVDLGQLQLGGVTLHDVWAIEDDNWGVDGIIGFPTLGNVNFLFDLSKRELLVSEQHIPMRGSFTLRYDAPLNVPTVPVQIGGRTIPLLLDTGDDAYGLDLRSSELADAALEGPLVEGKPVFNGATKQLSKTGVLKDPVKLGPVEAIHANFAINDDLPVGDFGVDALKQFRFQVEPGRRRIEFEPLFRGRHFITTVKPARR